MKKVKETERKGKRKTKKLKGTERKAKRKGKKK